MIDIHLYEIADNGNHNLYLLVFDVYFKVNPCSTQLQRDVSAHSQQFSAIRIKYIICIYGVKTENRYRSMELNGAERQMY